MRTSVGTKLLIAVPVGPCINILTNIQYPRQSIHEFQNSILWVTKEWQNYQTTTIFTNVKSHESLQLMIYNK